MAPEDHVGYIFVGALELLAMFEGGGARTILFGTGEDINWALLISQAPNGWLFEDKARRKVGHSQNRLASASGYSVRLSSQRSPFRVYSVIFTNPSCTSCVILAMASVLT